jgi:hypothetical protein
MIRHPAGRSLPQLRWCPPCCDRECQLVPAQRAPGHPRAEPRAADGWPQHLGLACCRSRRRQSAHGRWQTRHATSDCRTAGCNTSMACGALPQSQVSLMHCSKQSASLADTSCSPWHPSHPAQPLPLATPGRRQPCIAAGAFLARCWRQCWQLPQRARLWRRWAGAAAACNSCTALGC